MTLVRLLGTALMVLAMVMYNHGMEVVSAFVVMAGAYCVGLDDGARGVRK